MNENFPKSEKVQMGRTKQKIVNVSMTLQGNTSPTTAFNGPHISLFSLSSSSFHKAFCVVFCDFTNLPE